MTTIHIALASDDRYAPFLGVALTSILSNAREEDAFAFHILDAGISTENREKIESLRNIHPFEMEYIHPDLAEYVQKIHLKRSANNLARFFLPELLSEDVKRCIYLDADLVVLDSLHELWETDLGGMSLAAAPDIVVVSRLQSTYPLRIGKKGMYINSGVLLLDVEKLRENRMFQVAKTWYQEHHEECKMTDQDTLNICFDTQIHVLDASWNVQQNRSYDTYRNHFIRAEYREAWNEPKIIHFIGRIKPWHAMYLSSGREVFWEYVRRSPWSDMTPPKPTEQEARRIRRLTHPVYRAVKWCFLWVKLVEKKVEHFLYKFRKRG